MNRKEFLEGLALAGGTVAFGQGCATNGTETPLGRELGPAITDWSLHSHPTLKGKKASFFIDDTIWVLRDMTRTRPRSAFDTPMFKMLKETLNKPKMKQMVNLPKNICLFHHTNLP